jgi:YbbR domain-containing protein
MWGLFQNFKKAFPTFFTALILSITIWIIAVTANDPAENRSYPRNIPIEIVGQDPNLVLTNDLPTNVSVVINTPQSVWNSILTMQSPIRAVVDLSGLMAGNHTVELQIQVNVRPVKVVSYSPRAIAITLEGLSSKVMPLNLIVRGDPAIGYQAEEPELSTDQVTVTGPISQVERVVDIQAELEIGQAYEDVSRILAIAAYDQTGTIVDGVTLTPNQIEVFQDITQRYGYRNVIVSVDIEGQVADGYRLTNIAVFPLAVTVFSSNPQFVNELPGYVQTMPLNLDGLKDDVDVSLLLDLPDGVNVVGDQRTVLVRVSIAAVQTSAPIANIPIEIIGLAENLKANLAPEMVTILISGPLPLIDSLNSEDIRVYLDLTDYEVGTYQLQPMVELPSEELKLDNIQPELIDIEVIVAPTPTPGG